MINKFTLGFLENAEAFVLRVPEELQVFSEHLEQLAALRLEVRLLLVHDVGQQLLLQPGEGDGEADDGDLRADGRQEVRVAQGRRHVEPGGWEHEGCKFDLVT